MKKVGRIAFLSLIALLVQPVVAQQQPAAQPKQQPTAPAQPPVAAPSPSEVDAQIAKMQELMTQMNQQMAELQLAKDPAERQRLLQQHWATMQSAMSVMHGAWGMGMGMQGGHMMGPMMSWGDYRNMTPEQRAQRQYMMDRWMPMQQMMMEHMMQQQGAMMQPPAQAVPPKPAK